MQKFTSVEDLVNQLKPDKPVYCIRKKPILSASKLFQKRFPGKILYAVKTNPHPEVIKTLVKVVLINLMLHQYQRLSLLENLVRKRNVLLCTQ